MLPRIGVRRSVSCTWSSIRPPRTRMSPESTITVVVRLRLLVTRSTAPADPADTAETSWLILSWMVSPSLICGVMPSVMPTSLRSIVWNGLTMPVVLLVPVLENWPDRNGTSWPTEISASSLSMVTSVGVDRILVLPSPAKAFSRNRKLVPFSLMRPPAAVMPCSINAAAAAPVMLPVAAPATLPRMFSVSASRMLAAAIRSLS